MIELTQGNLLEADVDAVVNTVNTVGVMGKGIALMFKEKYPENFREYAAACKSGEVKVGEMFVTQSPELTGPRWIVNFPTKEHWRTRTKPEWVEAGLVSLKNWIVENGIRSIAIPPLGCGNGGLSWREIVKPMILRHLAELPQETKVLLYEPTKRYQNVVKKEGVEKLTPSRAMIAEMVRRYGVLGFDCTIVEVQKLAWFLERILQRMGMESPLDLRFEANKFGPSSHRLMHLLNQLDGSYLGCEKRIADASPFDVITFSEKKKGRLENYIKSDVEMAPFVPVLNEAEKLIEGFESPLGMEALATVDWLVDREGVAPDVAAIRDGLLKWPAGKEAGERKRKVFTDRMLAISLKRLQLLGS